MKIGTLILSAALAIASTTCLSAQIDTSHVTRTGDTAIAPGRTGASSATPARPWYDTLTVTQPHTAHTTAGERLALAAFTAVALPVGATVGLITLLPPSINVLTENGTPQTGFGISTGIGFGGDTTEFIFFPDFRVQLEGAYFLTRRPGPMARASLLFDVPLFSVHRRKFFWLGLAGGGGVSTDFTMLAPYAEGWIGLINPMGIRFLTLFPQHNYGLRARAGYNLTTGKPWYELSLCATSTFWY
jgi:hypothetical protein